MAEDSKGRKRANDLGPVGDRLAANLKRIREAQGKLSTGELAKRLAKLGRPIPATGITRIEARQRRVDADDLIALAIALDVAPNELLFPLEPGPVALTSEKSASFDEAWSWARGERPLGALWNPMSSQAARLIESNHPDMYADRGYETDMPTEESLKLSAAHRAWRKVVTELGFERGQR